MVARLTPDQKVACSIHVGTFSPTSPLLNPPPHPPCLSSPASPPPPPKTKPAPSSKPKQTPTKSSPSENPPPSPPTTPNSTASPSHAPSPPSATPPAPTSSPPSSTTSSSPSKRTVPPNLTTYNHLIKSFWKSGATANAYAVLEEMEMRKIKPDGGRLLGGFYREERLEDVENPNVRVLVDGLVSIGKLAEARGLIGQMKEKFTVDQDRWSQVEEGLPQ
ncbi:hypothetical protein ACLB2K_024707 [Fragaria x ananassa]